MSKLLYSIIDDLLYREEKGRMEYGTTMDRKDLSEQEWLQHAYEEALDLAIYLKKIIKTKQDENAKKLEQVDIKRTGVMASR